MSEAVWVELGPDTAGWRNGALPADGRPYKPSNAGSVYWALNEEIHTWLVERKVSYELSFRAVDDSAFTFNYRWLVRIPDASTAMLFKLTFA
jgi:hypothetical protein